MVSFQKFTLVWHCQILLMNDDFRQGSFNCLGRYCYCVGHRDWQAIGNFLYLLYRATNRYQLTVVCKIRMNCKLENWTNHGIDKR